ncbi:nitroreductase family protein [Natribaculum luteum]|uniref:Nitroreductase family protein n=1 Tax=Natribaculum luteum TaxID=1586232 RepID=A0ABD5NVL6_9EURY|nr:nitroreductase family protein [Natribaculum luteum]
MDVFEAIETRLEIKEFDDRRVDETVKQKVLDAGRLAPSGRNLQHWQFVLVDDPEDVGRLGELSPTGGWVADADFAVVVCTDPQYDFNELDAGRAVTHMQLAAWEDGVGSRIYTVDRPAVKEFLEIPDDVDLTLVAGFGYPTHDVEGVKDRRPLEEVASRGRYGRPLE